MDSDVLDSLSPASYPSCQSRDSDDRTWMGTRVDIDFGDFAIESIPLPEPEAVHRIGAFEFSETQLEYVQVSLELSRGVNTARDVLLVFKYKWPEQYRQLVEKDLELVVQWLCPGSRATKLVNVRDARIVKRLIENRPSDEAGGINDYKCFREALEPEDGEYRVFDREWYASRSPEVIQLVNTFNIELCEAEVECVRRLVKEMKTDVVNSVLASKLLSDLSVSDIALGMTSHFTQKLKGYRYVWMLPFTVRHVETIWHHSRRYRTASFKLLAGRTKGDPGLSSFQRSFMTHVRAGRADKLSVMDPRACGTVKSAIDVIEEIMYLFESGLHGKLMLKRLMAQLKNFKSC